MSSAAHAIDAKGRDAHKPTDIPAPGWKEILLRVYKQFTDDRILLVAAGTTFYLLLAMVPSLTALVSLYGLFAEPAGVQQQMAFIQDFMPGGGQEILADQLARLSSQPNAGLGVALVVSLGIAFWSSNAGMKALFEAMNVAYGEREKRGFVKLTLISLAFTVGATVLMLAILGVVVVLPLVVGLVELGSLNELAVKVGSSAVLIVAAMVGLSALYRWGPSRSEAKWQWITPGAGVAVVVALIVSLLFSWYVANFGSYNETYGSLGAIIGFMTWLWIMTAFVITGAEINAEMEHQTRRDTTTGPEQALGTRGARMADTVARGPEDTEDRADVGSGPAHGEPRHGARPGARPDASRRTPGRRDREPFGFVGGLLLLGAVVLVLTADNKAGSGPPARERR